MRIVKLKLRKLNNTRDLGGFPAEDGKTIKYGMLIRSGKLNKLPRSTVAKLEKMGVSMVVDLRIDNEVDEHPSTPLKGAKYIRVPLICTPTAGITHGKSMAGVMLSESKRLGDEYEDAAAYMTKVYSEIMFTEASQEKIKEVLDIIINEKGCVLWNCSGGKDRAGIIAMLVEALLGVDDELILEDYLASKKFQIKKRTLQRIGLVIAPIPLRFKRILRGLMAVDPDYIGNVIKQLNQRYGSIIGYCKQALGITDEQINLFRDKCLE